MEPDPDVQNVLRAIFSHDDRVHQIEKWLAPTYPDLEEFAFLIAKDANEEAFQDFIERTPSMLAGAVHAGSDDSFYGILAKPRVGPFYADFATFVVSQGGCCLTLVEIEKPHSKMFTKDGKTTGDLRTAENQVDQWKSHIRLNEKAYVREKVDSLCKCPLFEVGKGGSFRTREPRDIRTGWQAYGGFDFEVIKYFVVCGRWSMMSDYEQRWFLARSTDPGRGYQLRTFEQLARDAFTGLYICPTH